MKTTRPDLSVLVGSTLRRYRRGEIGERTARIEAGLVKALVDAQGEGDKPLEIDITRATDEELDVLARARAIIDRIAVKNDEDEKPDAMLPRTQAARGRVR